MSEAAEQQKMRLQAELQQAKAAILQCWAELSGGLRFLKEIVVPAAFACARRRIRERPRGPCSTLRRFAGRRHRCDPLCSQIRAFVAPKRSSHIMLLDTPCEDRCCLRFRPGAKVFAREFAKQAPWVYRSSARVSPKHFRKLEGSGDRDRFWSM